MTAKRSDILYSQQYTAYQVKQRKLSFFHPLPHLIGGETQDLTRYSGEPSTALHLLHHFLHLFHAAFT